MKEKSKSIKVVAILLLFFAILAEIIIFFIANGSEQHTITEGANRVVTALDCTSGSIEGAFFSSKTANTVKNQIKVTFVDDKIDKLSFTYEGVYRSNEVAEAEELDFHSKYNIYMGDNQHTLTPLYSTVRTKLRLSLYADNTNVINRVSAKLFFIDEERVKEFLDYSRDEVKGYYEEKGFLCEKQN